MWNNPGRTRIVFSLECVAAVAVELSVRLEELNSI